MVYPDSTKFNVPSFEKLFRTSLDLVKARLRTR